MVNSDFERVMSRFDTHEDKRNKKLVDSIEELTKAFYRLEKALEKMSASMQQVMEECEEQEDDEPITARIPMYPSPPDFGILKIPLTIDAKND